MFKIKMEWELTNGKKYSDWTIPWDIAEAEAATGITLYTQVMASLPPTMEQQFRICYSMQKRLDEKPIGRFEDWRNNVIHITAKDFENTNFTKLEASTEV